MEKNNRVQFASISIDSFLKFKTRKVDPIPNSNIPNLNVPAALVGKKRATEALDTIGIAIRSLLNTLTNDNIASIKEKVRQVVIAKTQNVETLHEIANEFLQQFLISEQHIKNYVQILNVISQASVITNSDVKVSKTIGNLFLEKCRETMFQMINANHIRKLALLDIDDIDELDKYNKERDKIINLITTICVIYEQTYELLVPTNMHKQIKIASMIKLSATNLCSVIIHIFDEYNKLQHEMAQLGNPYTDECGDEMQYLTNEKMCTIYSEFLYTFFYKCHSMFENDKSIIRFDATNEITPNQLFNRFKTQIIPTLTESYMIQKCKELTIQTT